ncbi:hypothetical protein WN944_018002 [Citrus x changshan-huyou]|uniref:Uncharacterized protein n=1 Tax=Citrus x changshan-huyou TaxID=2935761 RepID=A0AAP0LYX1_9ROSI
MPSLPSESVRKATDRSREKPRKRLLDWPRTALVGSLLSASSRLTGREEKRSLDWYWSREKPRKLAPQQSSISIEACLLHGLISISILKPPNGKS